MISTTSQFEHPAGWILWFFRRFREWFMIVVAHWEKVADPINAGRPYVFNATTSSLAFALVA